MNSRGLEQLLYVFEKLYQQAEQSMPKEYKELGELISIDGSLIDAVLSMYWADCQGRRESVLRAPVYSNFCSS